MLVYLTAWKGSMPLRTGEKIQKIKILFIVWSQIVFQCLNSYMKKCQCSKSDYNLSFRVGDLCLHWNSIETPTFRALRKYECSDASASVFFMVSDIIDIPFLLSGSPFEMTFGRKILSIRLIEAFGFKLEDFQFTLWCHRYPPAFWFTQEDAEDIAFEEWLSSPCGF